jgi:hypothetical protein
VGCYHSIYIFHIYKTTTDEISPPQPIACLPQVWSTTWWWPSYKAETCSCLVYVKYTYYTVITPHRALHILQQVFILLTFWIYPVLIKTRNLNVAKGAQLWRGTCVTGWISQCSNLARGNSFSFLQNVHSPSGAHPASYSVGTGVLSTRLTGTWNYALKSIWHQD